MIHLLKCRTFKHKKAPSGLKKVVGRWPVLSVPALCFAVSGLFLSCNQNYGGSGAGNTTGSTTQGAGTLNPNNYNSQITGGEWGGVTCLSGGTDDPGFMEYISNGTDTREDSNSIGFIHCNPSNSGGILFKMKVSLNAKFDPNGSNKNLSMQIASSSLEMLIMDDRSKLPDEVRRDLEGTPNIGALFQGLNGEVNGNRADLNFIYNGSSGWKKLRLEGTFDAQSFSGKMFFDNEKRLIPPETEKDPIRYSTPGASGTLGTFRIPTTHVFVSN